LYSSSVHTFVNTKDVTPVAGAHTSRWYSGISTASLCSPEVDIKRERGGKVTGPLLPSVPMELFDTYRLELNSKNPGTTRY